MKIIHKTRLSFKDLLDICKINDSSWDYSNEGKGKLRFFSILGGMTNYNVIKYNSVYMTVDKGKTVGYLMAYVSNSPKVYHPVWFLIYLICCFILSFSEVGRKCLAWRKLYHRQWRELVIIGKQYLLGKNYKKVSEGCCVAICPEYRKKGLYKEMLKLLFNEIGNGYFLFQTSTESDYQAHEAVGFKKILSAPFFYPDKNVTFIMYGKGGGELNLWKKP